MMSIDLRQLLQQLKRSGLLRPLLLFGVVLVGLNMWQQRLPERLSKQVHSAQAVKEMLQGRDVTDRPDTKQLRAAQAATHAPEITYDAIDARNPFEGPLHHEAWIRQAAETMGADTATGTVKTTLPRLIVQGVVWDGPQPYVIINGQTLQVGETIEEVDVVRIQAGYVTLSFQGVEFQKRPSSASEVAYGAARSSGGPYQPH